MSTRRIAFYLSLAFLTVLVIGAPIRSQYIRIQQGTAELIAGRNVNMVAGNKLPGGDPYVQRQNEPSIAVSTRNSMHLFAAANDYRTIDISEPYKVPGIPGLAASRDAWIGVFKSFNGGGSWITELLSGFPQDVGSTSPIHGFDTTCDPIVRAGTYGRFYMSGIAFNRSQNLGALFVSRYQDDNNLEGGDCIRYLGTKIVDTGNSGQFIDMPNMAVDIPRGNPYGNVYLAYTVFLGNTDINVRSRVVFVRSTDNGLTWSSPIKLTESQHIIQRPVIAIDPSDPAGNRIYVVFRRFAKTTVPGGIVMVKSVDGGKTFTKPADISTLLYPFDQSTTTNSFRTNSYPTMAIDSSGIVYVAWSQRLGGDAGQARIVLSTSTDFGLTWSATPQPVELFDEFGQILLGHQFMPSLTYAGGKLMLAWYDQRNDKAIDNLKFIKDSQGFYRHTIDVRVTEGVSGTIPLFSPSIQVSRYIFVLELDNNGNPIEKDGHFMVKQQEFNPPNLPLFQQGTVPFHGDYLEIAASPQFLPPTAGYSSWVYNTNALEPTIFHTTWTDNRDVWPPGGYTWGNWTLYTPPYSDQDPDWVPPTCTDGSYSGLRNQNVYTANISRGIIVGSPGNTKQLSITGAQSYDRRTFVVYLKNTTEFSKNLVLNIAQGNAGFDKELNDTDLSVSVAAYCSASVTVFVALSGNLAPVRVNVSEDGNLVGYVILNPDPTNPVINLDAETHNPRVDNPRVWNYDLGNKNEPHARILNPRVDNPRVDNPRVDNPRVDNPRVDNPRVDNPRVDNQSIVNHEVANPRVDNPRVDNTALTDVTWQVVNQGNTTSAYTFNLLSTAAQLPNFNPDSSPSESDPRLIAQVLVYKVFYNPAARACTLREEHSDELIANITNPRVDNAAPTGQGIHPMASIASADDLGLQDVTFYLEPQETAYVTFRVYDPIASDNIAFVPDEVTSKVVAEAPNTGETDPESAQPSRTPPGEPWTASPEIIATPSLMTFTAVSGGANPGPQPITITCSSGYTLNYKFDAHPSWLIPDSGGPYPGGTTHDVNVNISGLAAGSYPGTLTVYDTAEDVPFSNNPLKIPVTLTINPSGPPPATEWTARYNGPIANGNDNLRSMAVDSSGNVYVAGASEGGTGNPDYVTIKYDAAGNQLWARRYGGPGTTINSPNDLAVDSAGNVYVTGGSAGSTGVDYATIKYDAIGNQLWVARYNGPVASGDDVAYSLAVGPYGSVYVTGYCAASSGYTDFCTIKYDSSGNLLWAKNYNGPGNHFDTAYELVVDPLGNAYVAGTAAATSSISDYTLVKYDTNGNEVWVRTYDGPGLGFDVANEVALDSSGNVYVSGYSQGSGSGYDIATIMYDSIGNQLWVKRYDGPRNGDDGAQELLVDSSGSVYVTGEENRGTSGDYATIKYDTNGNQLWARLYNGPGDGDDAALEVAVDSAGNVYVNGYSAGIGSSDDYATIGYDSSGNERWVRRYNGLGNGYDLSHEVAVDSWGNVYIAGSSNGGGTNGFEIVTIKYRPTLQEWVFNKDGSNLNDVGNAIALDSSGNAWVTGKMTDSVGGQVITFQIYSNGNPGMLSSYSNGSAGPDDAGKSIAVHNATGDVYVAGTITGSATDLDYFTQKIVPGDPYGGWVRLYNGASSNTDEANAMTIDTAGNVYVTGRSYGTDYDFATIKYSPTGTSSWTEDPSGYIDAYGAARYSGSDQSDDAATAIAVDSSGNVYVTGWTDVDSGSGFSFDYLTIKYDSTGHRDWTRNYNVGTEDRAYAIAVDSSGNVYVTGAAGDYLGNKDCVTVKYDSAGTQMWAKTYAGPVTGTDVGAAIAIDSLGNIYVTGACWGGVDVNADYLTIKYDNDGTELWARTHNGPGSWWDQALDLALDSSGNIVVTGLSFGNMFDYATIKYDPNGNELWVMRYNGVDSNDDQARALAVDSNGNVFVTGQSFRTGYGYDYATVKYRKEGI